MVRHTLCALWIIIVITEGYSIIMTTIGSTAAVNLKFSLWQEMEVVSSSKLCSEQGMLPFVGDIIHETEPLHAHL